MEMAPDEAVRKLVLHFGIPRTVQTWDRVNERSTEAELNRFLCEMGWGTLDLDTGAWVMVSEEPCSERPDTSLVSYREYLEKLFPTGHDVEESTRLENLHQVNLRSSQFTANNEPGQKFRPMYEQMVRCLSVQKTVMKGMGLKVELDEKKGPEEGEDEAMNLVRFGRYQLLPGFFNLLMALQRDKRDFSIVFHSFGEEELSAVQKEIQIFCEGRHPCYNGKFKTKQVSMTGQEGTRDLRLNPAYLGKMVRGEDGPDGDDTCTLHFEARNSVVVKKEEAVAPAGEGEDGEAPAEGEGATEEEEGGSAEAAEAEAAEAFAPTRYTGNAAIYQGMLKEILEETSCVGILHDHAYWTANEESELAGKVLYVDPEETRVQHIFFDGNIQAENTYSVDVRDATSGNPIPYAEAKDVYFHRVNPVQATVEMNYFIEALQRCEQEHTERIKKKKRAKAEGKDEGKVFSRDELLELPAKEYLYKTVMPGLLPALELCSRDRPEDPINFIAFQLLRHPFSYKKDLID